MIGLLTFLSIALIVVILLQIGKVTELAAKIRGEESARLEANDRNARGMLVFLVVFLTGCVVSLWYYKDSMLGYGPHAAASEHGGEIDSMIDITFFFTGIVFVITHILLFWFAYKYREQKGRKALFMSHNNTLELVWTVIPAVVMSFLVVKGLVAWNAVMSDVGPNDEFIEIEATGMQFAWIMRYGGEDGKLGDNNYKLIDATNQVGQDWEDPKNLDDIVSSAPGEIIKLPLGKKIRVRIVGRDVLHDFDIPHMRVKMDAVPGLPTYFIFTPTVTTEEYRQRLGEVDERTGEPLYPEWHDPYDPTDPESKTRYEEFYYELACAELCGEGHYSMRRIIDVVPYEEWVEWMREQQPFYLGSIRGTDADPYKGQLLNVEVAERAAAFNEVVEKAIASTEPADKVIRLDNVTFETASAKLTALSVYELDNLANTLQKYPNMTIELAGHTDNTGDADSNMVLSEARANAVYNYLTGKKGVDGNRLTVTGYGPTKPVEANDTEDGRAKNRRTEFIILTQ